MNFVSRPRRFFIDDILASDFGRRCLEERNSVDCELNATLQTAAPDTAAAAGPTVHTETGDRTRLVSNVTAPDSDQSTNTRAGTHPSIISSSPSSSVTSSRRFRDNGMSTDSTISSSSSSSSGGDGRTALKQEVKVEPCLSTNTDVRTGTSCDVTSSTSSTSGGGKLVACKDSFTLPAWVYCTRYSDRPSAGIG